MFRNIRSLVPALPSTTTPLLQMKSGVIDKVSTINVENNKKPQSEATRITKCPVNTEI